MDKNTPLYFPASAAACIGIILSVMLFCYLRVNETKYIQERFNFSSRKVFSDLKDQLIKEGLTPLRLVNSYASTMRIAGRHTMTERKFKFIARMILSAGQDSGRECILWFSDESGTHTATDPAENSRSFPLAFSEYSPDADDSEVIQHLSQNTVEEYAKQLIDNAHTDYDFKTKIGILAGQSDSVLFFMVIDKHIRIRTVENLSIRQYINNIYGIAGLGFRFSRFMDNATENIGNDYETIEVAINRKNGKEEHLYSVGRRKRNNRISSHEKTEPAAITPWQGSIAVGNSLFSFSFYPSHTYIDRQRSIEPLIILCMGILFSAVTSVYVLTLLLQKRKIRDIAVRDSLTGIFNRGHFIRCLKEETDRCRRNGDTISIIMMDIDYFKHINDRYGHTTGDSVLLTFARIIQNYVRKTDIPGRVGGEEFAIALPFTGKDEAKTIADRIRARLEQESFTGPSDERFSVTVSVGIATFTPEDSLKDFLHRADQALYQAKEQGRNRIITGSAVLPGNRGQ